MGESSFWYRPTRVVPDQRPLNGRCCCSSFLVLAHLGCPAKRAVKWVCVCAHAVDGIRGIIVRTVLLTVHAYICMYMCTMRRGGHTLPTLTIPTRQKVNYVHGAATCTFILQHQLVPETIK